MSSRTRLMVSALVGLLLVLHAVAVEAQVRGAPQRNQQKPQTQAFTGKGTIEQIGGGMVKVKLDTGTDPALVKFASNGNIRVLGTAQPDFLRPQLMVQFNATLDKKTGHIEGDVKKLTICTPGPEFTPGCMPEAAGGGDAAAAATGLGLSGAAVAKPTKGRKTAVAKEEPGAHPYSVTGSIKKVSKTDSGYKISVRVPTVKAPVEITLAEDTKLDVNIADPTLSLVKPGDAIEITQGQGMKMQAGMMVMANEAHITLATPLSGAMKKGAHGKAGHAKKTEEGAAAELPGGAKPGAKDKDAKPADSK